MDAVHVRPLTAVICKQNSITDDFAFIYLSFLLSIKQFTCSCVLAATESSSQVTINGINKVQGNAVSTIEKLIFVEISFNGFSGYSQYL